MDQTDTWRWKSQSAPRICQLPKDVTANFTTIEQARKINCILDYEIKKGAVFRCWKYIFSHQIRYLVIQYHREKYRVTIGNISENRM
jgi:hypothetical protein